MLLSQPHFLLWVGGGQVSSSFDTVRAADHPLSMLSRTQVHSALVLAPALHGGTLEQRDPRHLCCTQVLPLSCVVRLWALRSAQAGLRPAELQPPALRYEISKGMCAKHKCKLDGFVLSAVLWTHAAAQGGFALQAAEHGVPRSTVPPQRAAPYHQHRSRGRCMLRMQLKAVLTLPDAGREHANISCPASGAITHLQAAVPALRSKACRP